MKPILSKALLIRAVQLHCRDLSAADAAKHIEEAQRIIENLIHYKHGKHEDEDIVTVAVALVPKDKQ